MMPPGRPRSAEHAGGSRERDPCNFECRQAAGPLRRYTSRVATEQWVRDKLAEIERKREVLVALRDSLEAWERDIDWEELPPEKQAALMALAEESVSTLQTIIARLKDDIQAGLAGLPPGSGAQDHAGDPG